MNKQTIITILLAIVAMAGQAQTPNWYYFNIHCHFLAAVSGVVKKVLVIM